MTHQISLNNFNFLLDTYRRFCLEHNEEAKQYPTPADCLQDVLQEREDNNELDVTGRVSLLDLNYLIKNC